MFNLTDGVISGKTGFTGKAGYCYVCACEKDGKCFIIALLGCGWPNNKTYKWKDTIRLLRYGEDTFDLFVLQKELPLSKIPVTKGTTEDYKWGQTVCVNVAVQIPEGEETETILIRKGEKVSCRVKLPNILSAPIKKDQEVGEVSWYIGRQKWKSHPVRTVRKVDKISFRWCFGKLLQEYIP